MPSRPGSPKQPKTSIRPGKPGASADSSRGRSAKAAKEAKTAKTARASKTPNPAPSPRSPGAHPSGPRLLSPEERRERAKAVIRILRREYPDAKCSLDHKNAFQLLIATILSAQCTDARVNLVTPGLFKKYPTPRDFAEAPLAGIEEDIRSTGFYRNKAKAIQGCCGEIVDRFGGQVPRTMDELFALPGVGRKTANVVLGVAYGEPDGAVVDTHVARVSWKLGLTTQKDPVKIERDLNEAVPRKDWVMLGHLLIYHGRAICKARQPDCDRCPIYQHCEVRA
jgi:endonuclease-3